MTLTCLYFLPVYDMGEGLPLLPLFPTKHCLTIAFAKNAQQNCIISRILGTFSSQFWQKKILTGSKGICNYKMSF